MPSKPRSLAGIRIDRRIAEDEVVRVTLQDEDGTVPFEGEVQ